jgi:predicted nucleic acid-binding protein
MITLDTSGVIALLDARDSFHEVATRALEGEGDLVVPAMALSEMTYMMERWVGRHVVDPFLAGFEQGSPLLDCGDLDVPRIRELMDRYSDLRLDFPDAAVIACAERNGGRVLTFDRRDFEVVGRDAVITLLP